MVDKINLNDIAPQEKVIEILERIAGALERQAGIGKSSKGAEAGEILARMGYAWSTNPVAVTLPTREEGERMAYFVEHYDDGDIGLTNEVDHEDHMRMARAKFQALHEAGTVVCAGCKCYKNGYTDGIIEGREERKEE